MDYISREEVLRAVTGAELPDKTVDGLPIASGKRSVSDCVRRIKAIPAADVVSRKSVLDIIETTVCEPCRANHHDPDDCPCDKCLACELMDKVEGWMPGEEA